MVDMASTISSHALRVNIVSSAVRRFAQSTRARLSTVTQDGWQGCSLSQYYMTCWPLVKWNT